MSRTISQRELRNDSGKIMRALESGEHFTLTRNGTPVAEIVPLRRHRYVSAEAVSELFRNAPPIDYVSFRSDLEEFTDQDITPHA